MGQKQQKKRKKQKQRKHRRHSSDQQKRSYSRQERSRHKSSHHHHRDESPKRKHKKRRRETSSQQQRGREHQYKGRQVEPIKRQIDGWKSSPEPSGQGQVKQQVLKNAEGENNPAQAPKKQQPNFEPSGILLKYYNARQGIALKFHEPAQSHAPLDQWRIYPFKQNAPLLPIILNKSCYLIGKDERICDILCQNQSISRQHAVIQFRSQYTMQIDGTYTMEVKPYIMDLESTNGTVLNGEQIESSRYYELLEKDMLKFGLSQRQYVMFKVPSTKAPTNLDK